MKSIEFKVCAYIVTQTFFANHKLNIRHMWLYIKLLDFLDFAVQAAKSRIGPFASRILNLTQSIDKKVKTCNGKSVDK